MAQTMIWLFLKMLIFIDFPCVKLPESNMLQSWMFLPATSKQKRGSAMSFANRKLKETNQFMEIMLFLRVHVYPII